MKIRITFTEPVLGTAPNNKEIYTDYIASNAPDAKDVADEIASVGLVEATAKGKTVFPSDENGPFLWDYHIKGFFKDACGMLYRVPGTKSNKLKAYKKVIDGLIFPNPRKIYLHLPKGATMGECQRPLRAQTAQGERVALAFSDEAPAGTVIEFDIETLGDAHDGVITEWLNYGKLRGIGQWRNSGKGRFDWVEIA